MTAGLFLCDHVNEEYQSTFGDYSDMFMQLFPEFEWKLYDAINGQYPEDIEECDIYFSTGSRMSVYEKVDWMERLKEIIQEIYQKEKYFIGFCFGHQLLAEALGGKVEKAATGWCVGVYSFEVIAQEKWMSPVTESYNVLMMCQDQVVQLPKNAKVLARNEKCPIGMYQVGKNMLGIQGHPEFSKAYTQLLMENRISRMGKKVVDEGIESLAKEVHTERIRQWILKFVKYH